MNPDPSPQPAAAPHDIVVRGIGAVSPAGWGVGPLCQSLRDGHPLPVQALDRPGWKRPLRVRQVPPSAEFNPRLLPPRLRRSSAISHMAFAAAREALGDPSAHADLQGARLGLVFATMSGSVHYSRRFYQEVLEDPETASPVLFPETVFNAPASHLASVFGATVDYTLVGDVASFLDGLAVACAWLADRRVDLCLVTAAEEHDWLTADAFRHFSRELVVAEGASALCLTRQDHSASPLRLHSLTPLHTFSRFAQRPAAARHVRAGLAGSAEAGLLCDGQQGVNRLDAADCAAWKDWPGQRLSPKRILGEGLTAASGWMCVAALNWLAEGHGRQARVAVNGLSHQCAGVLFRNSGM